jgi:hypothetical protein
VYRHSGRQFSLFFDRPAVVMFRTYPAAHFVARAVDHRLSVLGTMAETQSLVPAPFSSCAEPEHVFVQAWEDVDNLTKACSNDGADMLVCSEFEARLNRPIGFEGRLFRIKGGGTPL